MQIKLNDILIVINADFEYFDYAPSIATTKIVIRETKHIVTKITKKYITINKYQGSAYGRHQFSSMGAVKENVNTFNLSKSKYSRTKIKAIEKEINLIPKYIKKHEEAIKLYEASVDEDNSYKNEIEAEKIFIRLYKTKAPKMLKTMLTKAKNNQLKLRGRTIC